MRRWSYGILLGYKINHQKHCETEADKDGYFRGMERGGETLTSTLEI